MASQVGGHFTFMVSFLGGCLRTELVKCSNEFARDLLCGGLLNHKSLHQVNELSVTKNCDCRRSGRIAVEVAARALGGLAILTRKDRDLMIRLVRSIR